MRLRFKSHVRILSWRFSKYPDDNAPAGHPGRWLLGFNSFLRGIRCLVLKHESSGAFWSREKNSAYYIVKFDIRIASKRPLLSCFAFIFP